MMTCIGGCPAAAAAVTASTTSTNHRFKKKKQHPTATTTDSASRNPLRQRRRLFCLLFLTLILILSLVWTFTTTARLVVVVTVNEQNLPMTTTAIPMLPLPNKRKNFPANNNNNYYNNQHQQDQSLAASSCPWWKSDDCLHETAAQMARVWKDKPYWQWCHNRPLTAFAGTNNTTNNSTTFLSARRTGILLVKLPKAASSTVAGLLMRIAQRHDCLLQNTTMGDYYQDEYIPLATRLNVEWQHQSAYEAGYHHHHHHHRLVKNKDIDDRTSAPSTSSSTFLVAPLRRPDTRALSSVYYHSVSLQPAARRRQVSDSFILRQLQRQPANYMVQYLRLDNETTTTTTTTTTTSNSSRNDSLSSSSNFQQLQNAMQGILDHYDFLIITEEMEASLIVLGWIMHIDLKDLLVLSSKTTNDRNGNGSFYFNGRRCIRLVPPVRTPAILDYFQKSDNDDINNSNWPTRHAADRLLHMAANQSLYQTIEQQLTWPIFRQRQAALRRLQNDANRACAAEIAVQQPCHTSHGSANSGQPPQFNNASQKACYIRDFGCGFECYNRFVDGATITTT
jgi:Galactose-3-O-sulfotransferase